MMASDLVLIAGVGDVGRVVLDQLRAHEVPVRVMVRRDDDRAAQLRVLGAEVAIGDLTTTTAHGACATTCSLTDPRSMPVKPPCPRLPTTSRSAPAAASSSTVTGCP